MYGNTATRAILTLVPGAVVSVCETPTVAPLSDDVVAFPPPTHVTHQRWGRHTRGIERSSVNAVSCSERHERHA